MSGITTRLVKDDEWVFKSLKTKIYHSFFSKLLFYFLIESGNAAGKYQFDSFFSRKPRAVVIFVVAPEMIQIRHLSARSALERFDSKFFQACMIDDLVRMKSMI